MIGANRRTDRQGAARPALLDLRGAPSLRSRAEATVTLDLFTVDLLDGTKAYVLATIEYATRRIRIDPDVVRAQLGRLTEVCAEEGRDPAGIRRLVHCGQDTSILASFDRFVDTLSRYEEAGVTDLVVPMPHAHETAPGGADMKTLEEIASRLLS